MSPLLISEPPLQVLPSLAVAVGLNEANVLQQINYWMGRTNTVINGQKWVYNTVSQWREQFPFWSDDTIGRALKSLREKGIVIAEKLSSDAFNKTLFYRIDYAALHPSITASCGDRESQDASLSIQRLRTETTQREHPPAPKGERRPNGFEEFWQAWPASPRKVGKKQCADKWAKKKFGAITEEILVHVTAMKMTKQWQDGFEPAPMTYLNGERWRDGVPMATSSSNAFAGAI